MTLSRKRNLAAKVASRLARSGETAIRPPNPRPPPAYSASAASMSSESAAWVIPRSSNTPGNRANFRTVSAESVAPSSSSLTTFGGRNGPSAFAPLSTPLKPASTAAVSGVRFFTFGSRPFHRLPSPASTCASSGESVARPRIDRPGPR